MARCPECGTELVFTRGSSEELNDDQWHMLVMSCPNDDCRYAHIDLPFCAKLPLTDEDCERIAKAYHSDLIKRWEGL